LPAVTSENRSDLEEDFRTFKQIILNIIYIVFLFSAIQIIYHNRIQP